jgi:hypothetical protein
MVFQIVNNVVQPVVNKITNIGGEVTGIPNFFVLFDDEGRYITNEPTRREILIIKPQDG